MGKNEIFGANVEAEKAEDQLAMGREGETTEKKEEHEHQFTIEAPPIHESIYDSDKEIKLSLISEKTKVSIGRDLLKMLDEDKFLYKLN